MQHICKDLPSCGHVQARHGRFCSAVRPAEHAQVASPLRLTAPLFQKAHVNRAFTSSRSSIRSKTFKRTTKCSATSTFVGLGVFFTPSIVAVIYAYFKGKGNVKDGLSRLLTEVTQGYFQPNVGGESIPVAQGELSDLAGDEPLFKALYQWWAFMQGSYKAIS